MSNTSLSFEKAIQLFRQWGFQVEPGPQPEEVTLMIDAADHRTYCVYPAAMLADIAAVALTVRMRNGTLLSAWHTQRMPQPQYGIAPMAVESTALFN